MGAGCRTLSIAELCTIVGFSETHWHVTVSVASLIYTPLQLHHALLDPVIPTAAIAVAI